LAKYVNDVVSITYTAEIKGATSSDIFPVENGPIELLVGDRKNIRAGLYTGRSGFLVAAITNII
jgi:FKBP-type peptidyl-prolyl cis-trans isomerase 2